MEKRSPSRNSKASIRKRAPSPIKLFLSLWYSYSNKGVQKLLDAIVDYMPAPTDIAILKVSILRPARKSERPSSDDKEPFAALAFKIATDPLLVSCASSVFIPVLDAGPPFTMLIRTNMRELAVSFRCTQTTARILKLAMQEISPRLA